jgi:hypothetical protein
MAWYVFALVDAVPASRPGKGIGGALSMLPVGGAFAVAERRADVPPAAFGSLQKHQDVVTRIASCVPAILPVRFGTLLERVALDEALEDRDEEIAGAFALVRGRVQFTWRKRHPASPKRVGVTAREGGREAPGAREARGAKRGAADTFTALGASGTDYLRHAARAAKPAPPAAWRNLRSTLAPLFAAERYQPATATLPESLYHLVARTSSVRYATVAAGLRHTNPALTMSGPWPPFAFAPEIL